MRRLVFMALVLALPGLAGPARADDKANPTGTWKWSAATGNRTREMTLRLKLDEGKLTGALVGRNGQETPIEDATYKDGTVSFSLTRERNGRKLTTKYTGQVSGDTIKGKIESERRGQLRSQDWAAQRSKD